MILFWQQRSMNCRFSCPNERKKSKLKEFCKTGDIHFFFLQRNPIALPIIRLSMRNLDHPISATAVRITVFRYLLSAFLCATIRNRSSNPLFRHRRVTLDSVEQQRTDNRPKKSLRHRSRTTLKIKCGIHLLSFG